MSKIPFTLDAWLKDKSQKVETRDGRLVHNIWRVKEPTYKNNRKTEVCALIDGEEDALVFFDGGRYLPTTKDTDSPFDLFIVTPEEELTEFEKELESFYNHHLQVCTYDNQGTVEDSLHGGASKLIAIARKELCDQIVDHTKEAYENGRADALKDLPRWRKWENGAAGNSDGHPIALVSGAGGIRFVSALGITGEKYIMLADLKKLPGFKEDESHE